jgi:hypothetical protein
MRFDPPGIGHCFLEGLTVGFIQTAMCAAQHFGALLVTSRVEPIGMAGHFDLMAQRKLPDASNDGFND